MAKLVIIGLDCATPQLVFGDWLDELPNIKSIVDEGMHGKMVSTIPPITVPAWTAMMTSQDPGMLGFYGFRNRKSYGYDDLYFANANYVKAKTLWNYLSRNRMSSLVFGVPQTYPPKPLNGMLVASFLTPNKDAQYTWPDEVKAEVDSAAGGNYIIDVDDFRTDDKDKLLKAIYEMTESRFKAFRHFVQKDFDFAMMVEMGIDRIHHGFWRYFDKEHRLYEPGNKYENAIKDYYKEIDREIGETLKVIGEDTSVILVSDHGAKTMHGAICINEWFQREGFLTLKEKPAKQTKLKMDMIDWEKTSCWGEGGYYSRIFFNVKGREPQGVIPSEEYESFRTQLIAKLEAMTDENGKSINNRVFRPEDVYKECNNIAPDLILYPGNLDWRSAGSVGTGCIHIYENDTGPDDANHAQEGIFVWKIPGREWTEKERDVSIYDIAPSILKFYGIDIPENMIGKPII